MSLRTSKIESLLIREISKILANKLSDPRIRGLISITRIDVTPDTRTAFVYVSVIPEKYVKRSIHGLRSASGRIHRDLVKLLNMRMVPRIQFEIDDSIKKQAEIDAAIKRGLPEDYLLETDNEDQQQTKESGAADDDQ